MPDLHQQTIPRESELLGWQLFVICLALFPPGISLIKYVQCHFSETIFATEKHGMSFDCIKSCGAPLLRLQLTVDISIAKGKSSRFAAYARWCQRGLDKILDFGVRKNIPSVLELENIKVLRKYNCYSLTANIQLLI